MARPWYSGIERKVDSSPGPSLLDVVGPTREDVGLSGGLRSVAQPMPCEGVHGGN